MGQEIKELALQAATAEALELVLELRELKANLSLELEATRNQRVAEARERRALAEAMRELIVSIQANECINQSVLHLIEPPRAGEVDGTEEERRRAEGTDTNTRRSVSHG